MALALLGDAAAQREHGRLGWGQYGRGRLGRGRLGRGPCRSPLARMLCPGRSQFCIRGLHPTLPIPSHPDPIRSHPPRSHSDPDPIPIRSRSRQVDLFRALQFCMDAAPAPAASARHRLRRCCHPHANDTCRCVLGLPPLPPAATPNPPPPPNPSPPPPPPSPPSHPMSPSFPPICAHCRRLGRSLFKQGLPQLAHHGAPCPPLHLHRQTHAHAGARRLGPRRARLWRARRAARGAQRKVGC